MDSRSPEQFDTPILFLIFNRPDLTARVFERIRELRPKYLFVAADGPRKDKPEDIERCEVARNAVLSRIDWPCELNTLFRDKNLGCGIAVSEAITWFFEHVEMGIILEDDCLPDISFFDYCSHLLIKYKNDNRVMHIGGVSFLFFKNGKKHSYFFSTYSHIWGWATWKRSWKLYCYKPNVSRTRLKDILFSAGIRGLQLPHWTNLLLVYFNDPSLNTWGYSWQFTIWANKGLSVSPISSIVQNLGFGNDSTHTKQNLVDYNRHKVLPITSLKGPDAIEINSSYDKRTFNNHFRGRTTIMNHFRNLTYRLLSKNQLTKLKKIKLLLIRKLWLN